MAEGQQPGIANQEVEGAGEQAEAQELHQEHRVGEHGRGQRDGQGHHA
jgi:hypothetical protein